MRGRAARRRATYAAAWLLVLSIAAAGAAGCRTAAPAGQPATAQPSAVQPTLGSLEAQAAREATAIVQSARATSIVRQAEAAATALIEAAGRPPTSAPAVPLPAATTTGGAAFPASASSADTAPTATAEASPAGAVELLSVGTAADGAFIVVTFKAPPLTARQWMQGNVHVVDEMTGVAYSEIPTLGAVGPLFARPVEPGQPGYVMFVNPGGSLRSGARVTVILGDFKQEHVTVE